MKAEIYLSKSEVAEMVIRYYRSRPPLSSDNPLLYLIGVSIDKYSPDYCTVQFSTEKEPG